MKFTSGCARPIDGPASNPANAGLAARPAPDLARSSPDSQVTGSHSKSISMMAGHISRSSRSNERRRPMVYPSCYDAPDMRAGSLFDPMLPADAWGNPFVVRFGRTLGHST